MSQSNLTTASEETKYPPKMSQLSKITNVTHAVITEKVVPDTKIMHKKKNNSLYIQVSDISCLDLLS